MAVSRSLRFQILRRDNNTCTYCGRKPPEVKLTIDHVVPEALGGSDDPSNLTTACEDCNGGKSATPADASTVAAVQEDARRWATAQQFVAEKMLEEMRQRSGKHDQFDAAWRRAGGPSRPSTWTRSVDGFLSAGLPIEVLVDCVDRAMSSTKVAAGERFRYFCGIAWARVAKMREEVAATVRAGSSLSSLPQPTEDDRYARVLALHRWEKDRLEVPAYEAGSLSMAEELLTYLVPEEDEVEAERLKKLGLARAADFDETAPEWDVEGFEARWAAIAGVEDLQERLWVFQTCASRLLDSMPSDMRDEIAASEREQRELHDPDSEYHPDQILARQLTHTSYRLFGIKPAATVADDPPAA